MPLVSGLPEVAHSLMEDLEDQGHRVLAALAMATSAGPVIRRG